MCVVQVPGASSNTECVVQKVLERVEHLGYTSSSVFVNKKQQYIVGPCRSGSLKKPESLKKSYRTACLVE
jgi:hypothetical protein